MKYLFIVFTLLNLNAFSQDYSQQIKQHRDKYKQDFIEDSNSPLKKKDLIDLHFFEADSTFRVLSEVEILTDEKIVNMQTFDGTSKEFSRFAKIKFRLKGSNQSLTLYKSIALAKKPSYKDLLFLPFIDETNGQETYGGGRYIDLNINDLKNGLLEIDFNKAYNPYCAYSDRYRCPVPPRENTLTLTISAGEKQFTGKKKHK